MQREGYRNVRVSDIWGMEMFDCEGRRIGDVVATLRLADDAVDVLVKERGFRGRVHRYALDDLELDDWDRLWRKSVVKAIRFGLNRSRHEATT